MNLFLLVLLAQRCSAFAGLLGLTSLAKNLYIDWFIIGVIKHFKTDKVKPFGGLTFNRADSVLIHKRFTDRLVFRIDKV